MNSLQFLEISMLKPCTVPNMDSDSKLLNERTRRKKINKLKKYKYKKEKKALATKTSAAEN